MSYSILCTSIYLCGTFLSHASVTIHKVSDSVLHVLCSESSKVVYVKCSLGGSVLHIADSRIKKHFRHFLEVLRHHNQQDHWLWVGILSVLLEAVYECECVCVLSPVLSSLFETLHVGFYLCVFAFARLSSGSLPWTAILLICVLCLPGGKSAHLKYSYQLTAIPYSLLQFWVITVWVFTMCVFLCMFSCV